MQKVKTTPENINNQSDDLGQFIIYGTRAMKFF